MVHRPPYSTTVTRKGSVPRSIILSLREHALVSLLIRKMTARLVTPESGLALEGILMTPTRVETRQPGLQIMESNTSKPWVTSWCSDKENKNNYFKHFKTCRMLLLSINLVQRMEHNFKGFLLVAMFTRQITM